MGKLRHWPEASPTVNPKSFVQRAAGRQCWEGSMESQTAQQRAAAVPKQDVHRTLKQNLLGAGGLQRKPVTSAEKMGQTEK